MIRLYDISELKWIGLSVFLAVFAIKVYLAPHDFEGIAFVGIGLAAYTIALAIQQSTVSTPLILWNEERSMLSIIRSWTLEVASARILSSVPIGIDLSHSGRKVLQSMYTRFSIVPGATLVFFITRPMADKSTRVGYLVRRKTLKLWNNRKQVDSLAKLLATDAMILESSMRAAYPHLPVVIADFIDILKTGTGGIETHVLQ